MQVVRRDGLENVIYDMKVGWCLSPSNNEEEIREIFNHTFQWKTSAEGSVATFPDNKHDVKIFGMYKMNGEGRYDLLPGADMIIGETAWQAFVPSFEGAATRSKVYPVVLVSDHNDFIECEIGELLNIFKALNSQRNKEAAAFLYGRYTASKWDEELTSQLKSKTISYWRFVKENGTTVPKNETLRYYVANIQGGGDLRLENVPTRLSRHWTEAPAPQAGMIDPVSFYLSCGVIPDWRFGDDNSEFVKESISLIHDRFGIERVGNCFCKEENGLIEQVWSYDPLFDKESSILGEQLAEGVYQKRETDRVTLFGFFQPGTFGMHQEDLVMSEFMIEGNLFAAVGDIEKALRRKAKHQYWKERLVDLRSRPRPKAVPAAPQVLELREAPAANKPVNPFFTSHETKNHSNEVPVAACEPAELPPTMVVAEESTPQEPLAKEKQVEEINANRPAVPLRVVENVPGDNLQRRENSLFRSDHSPQRRMFGTHGGLKPGFGSNVSNGQNNREYQQLLQSQSERMSISLDQVRITSERLNLRNDFDEFVSHFAQLFPDNAKAKIPLQTLMEYDEWPSIEANVLFRRWFLYHATRNTSGSQRLLAR